MATAPVGQLAPALTYEAYLAEGEINRRYDIVDGRRVFMPSPTRGHQRILKNLSGLLYRFEQASRQSQMYFAPMDILIRTFPLQTRQPDLLLISNDRVERAGITDETVSLPVAPELVVEVISASDREKVVTEKLADYASIGVRECWIVRPKGETVEVLALDGQLLLPVATYAQGQEVQSLVFPDLRVPIADIFAV